MEELNHAKARLQTARDNHERQYKAQIAKLDGKENILKKRWEKLDEKRFKTAQDNGDVGASDDDLIEVNAGGKIIAAKRSALTRLRGTRLEALFSGRWDKKLQRDVKGQIFLDVNPTGFRAIVDYLNELAISSEDDPPAVPSVDDEHKHLLEHQLELFRMSDMPVVEIPDSTIIKEGGHIAQLHDWLKDDGSDREFDLLYRSSRDGSSDENFHSKCDNQGCTITIIETACGFILGGYSNTPWKSEGSWTKADKAFLFVLCGSDISSPYKMEPKDANDSAVFHFSGYGPSFGSKSLNVCDLNVEGSKIYLKLGMAYESGPSGKLTANGSTRSNNDELYTSLAIKEREVFRVTARTSAPPQTKIASSKSKKKQNKNKPVPKVVQFSREVNEAITARQEALLQAELEMRHLEKTFEDEHKFVTTFACGDTKDVAMLNVSGILMATKRSTLQAVEDSVLARQFDDTKWQEQGCNTSRVKDWASDDVCGWVRKIEGIPGGVANAFKENEITGRELLALGAAGLNAIGVKRPGTVYLLIDEIKKLQEASQDSVTLIEHSPYCFGKILDFLRLKQLCAQGLAEEPDLPTVCDLQKSRFEKVAKYYFPGDSAKIILG